MLRSRSRFIILGYTPEHCGKMAAVKLIVTSKGADESSAVGLSRQILEPVLLDSLDIAWQNMGVR